MSQQEYSLTIEPFAERLYKGLITSELFLRVGAIRIIMKYGKSVSPMVAFRALIWISRPIETWRKMVDTGVAALPPDAREDLLRRWE